LRNRGSALDVDLVVEQILDRIIRRRVSRGRTVPGDPPEFLQLQEARWKMEELCQLRKACHAEVVARIAAEISKELASHRVSEIGKLVAAQRPQLPGGYAIRRSVPKCSGPERCQGSFMEPLGNISLV